MVSLFQISSWREQRRIFPFQLKPDPNAFRRIKETGSIPLFSICFCFRLVQKEPAEFAYTQTKWVALSQTQ
jgi:hypothetical protein